MARRRSRNRRTFRKSLNITELDQDSERIDTHDALWWKNLEADMTVRQSRRFSYMDTTAPILNADSFVDPSELQDGWWKTLGRRSVATPNRISTDQSFQASDESDVSSGIDGNARNGKKARISRERSVKKVSASTSKLDGSKASKADREETSRDEQPEDETIAGDPKTRPKPFKKRFATMPNDMFNASTEVTGKRNTIDSLPVNEAAKSKRANVDTSLEAVSTRVRSSETLGNAENSAIMGPPRDVSRRKRRASANVARFETTSDESDPDTENTRRRSRASRKLRKTSASRTFQEAVESTDRVVETRIQTSREISLQRSFTSEPENLDVFQHRGSRFEENSTDASHLRSPVGSNKNLQVLLSRISPEAIPRGAKDRSFPGSRAGRPAYQDSAYELPDHERSDTPVISNSESSVQSPIAGYSKAATMPTTTPPRNKSVSRNFASLATARRSLGRANESRTKIFSDEDISIEDLSYIEKRENLFMPGVGKIRDDERSITRTNRSVRDIRTDERNRRSVSTVSERKALANKSRSNDEFSFREKSLPVADEIHPESQNSRKRRSSVRKPRTPLTSETNMERNKSRDEMKSRASPGEEQNSEKRHDEPSTSRAQRVLRQRPAPELQRTTEDVTEVAKRMTNPSPALEISKKYGRASRMGESQRDILTDESSGEEDAQEDPARSYRESGIHGEKGQSVRVTSFAGKYGEGQSFNENVVGKQSFGEKSHKGYSVTGKSVAGQSTVEKSYAGKSTAEKSFSENVVKEKTFAGNSIAEKIAENTSAVKSSVGKFLTEKSARRATRSETRHESSESETNQIENDGSETPVRRSESSHSRIAKRASRRSLAPVSESRENNLPEEEEEESESENNFQARLSRGETPRLSETTPIASTSRYSMPSDEQDARFHSGVIQTKNLERSRAQSRVSPATTNEREGMENRISFATNSPAVSRLSRNILKTSNAPAQKSITEFFPSKFLQKSNVSVTTREAMTRFDPIKFKEAKEKLEEMKRRELRAMGLETNEVPKKDVNLKKLPFGGTKKKDSSTVQGDSKRSEKIVDKAYIVDGKVYKRPRLPRPKAWATDRLYRYLWKRMEPKHKLSTRVKSEKFVLTLSKTVTTALRRKKYESYKPEVDALMKEMARLGIIRTANDFYDFCYDFMPYDFRVKVTPILLPGNVLSIPYDPSKLHTPILQDG